MGAVAAFLLAATRALSSFLRRALTLPSVDSLAGLASVAWALWACSSLAASAARIFSSLRRRLVALAFSGSPAVSLDAASGVVAAGVAAAPVAAAAAEAPAVCAAWLLPSAGVSALPAEVLSDSDFSGSALWAAFGS
ncbi:hypothetical protein D3791_12145 [Glutamicibacter mishrai]|uniref:Uncharacterized protein n=1 Tax=Glutamicibacter mishrai TaxID=1775880 RepID=A0A6H0SMH8_9MICC|nr:hypothetical protein D3791_12145 [Glutamicibacter mishrai]